MLRVKPPHKMIFTEIAPVTFTIVAGAAGWIDQDFSTAAPAGTIAYVISIVDASQAHGCRANGSSLARTITTGAYLSWEVNVPADGIVELYRGAANAYYVCCGYWK